MKWVYKNQKKKGGQLTRVGKCKTREIFKFYFCDIKMEKIRKMKENEI